MWCVMSDGTVNALTYNKKQEICAWSKHITKGSFESVSVIREGYEDVPYFVVKRKINGQYKRYIERMHTRSAGCVSDGFFLDSALNKEFQSEVSSVSGLEHLERENVYMLLDGGVYEGTVKSGAVTLPYPAKKVTIGLPYTFEMETLNIEGENTHGLKKIISSVNIKTHKSREDFLVHGIDGAGIINPRSLESINDSDLLVSKDIEAYPYNDYAEEISVKISQPMPLPLTITSITADVNLEDN